MKWSLPLFGRPFVNNDDLSLVATPKGLYCRGPRSKELYRLEVTRGGKDQGPTIRYHKLDNKGLRGEGSREYRPFVYDSRRKRLLSMSGPKLGMVYERSLEKGPWKKVDVKGSAQACREAVYDPENDCVLALGEAKLFALDCTTNRWRQIKVSFPKTRGVSYGQNCAMVYDPVHTLTVMLIRSRLHLFKYDPKTARYKEAKR
jgi:hypothetical protein